MSMIVEIDQILKRVNSFTSGFSNISRRHKRLNNIFLVALILNKRLSIVQFQLIRIQLLYVIKLFLTINAMTDLPRRAAMLVNFAGQGECRLTQFQFHLVRM